MHTYVLNLRLVFEQHQSLLCSWGCAVLCHSPEHPLPGSGTQPLLLTDGRPCRSGPANVWPSWLTRQGLGNGGGRGSQSGRKSVRERNSLCPARTSPKDASGCAWPCHRPEEEGYSHSNRLPWTFSSGDGLSGRRLVRKIRVAEASARGWPEGQGPEEEHLAEPLPAAR